MGGLRKLRSKTVIVNLLGGDVPAIKGVVSGLHSDCVVVKDPVALDGESQTVMGGTVIVPKHRIDYFQEID